MPVAITPGAWEKARSTFDKEAPKRALQLACVCSHSKYHHQLIEEHESPDGKKTWGKCLNQEDCGCEVYDEIDWRKQK